jgi:oligoribonuclease
MQDAENLIWLDMEMSGLDPETCVILEIATLVTDKNLKLLAEGPTYTIYHPKSVLDQMDQWNQVHHQQSGLVEKVLASQTTLTQAEQGILEFLKNYCFPQTSPLCGNTIYQDRRFLISYMPSLERFFHYRLIDVSTIKELVKRWYGASFQPPPKKQTHQALLDIQESIEELKFYRNMVFKTP